MRQIQRDKLSTSSSVKTLSSSSEISSSVLKIRSFMYDSSGSEQLLGFSSGSQSCACLEELKVYKNKNFLLHHGFRDFHL